MKNKIKEFELGKFYKVLTKNRKFVFKILKYEYGSFRGICVKESRFENYINDSDIFHEPKECIEITEAEFLDVKNRVLELFENILN
ncbi:MAG: hypothetical protein KBA33_08290 [Cloacibacterium sp.]|nr:hypothetical protein [Cloacibacterium sp.]